MLNCPLVSGALARVNAWGYGDRALGGIVVGADSMGRMASSCTVGFYNSMILTIMLLIVK